MFLGSIVPIDLASAMGIWHVDWRRASVQLVFMTLYLDTWAFVRIMVALEESAPSLTGAALFQIWSQEWAEVDQRLNELAHSDFLAYSDMMLNCQIQLELPAQHATAFRTLVEGLIETMITKHQASADPEFKKDLNFEIEGLRALR